MSRLKFLAINSFNTIPVTKYIIDYLTAKGGFESVEIHHMKVLNGVAYLKDVNENAIEVFSSSSQFNRQSLISKVNKYSKLFLQLFKLFFANDLVVMYVIDFQLVPFCLVPRLFNSKYVHIVYHQFEVIDNSSMGSFTKLLYKAFIRAAHYIDLVIVPEENRGRILLNNTGIPSHKIKLFPNTCAAKQADFPISRSHYLQDIGDDDIIVGHIGNVGLGHYIINFLEAAPNLKNKKITYLFIGNYSDELISIFEKYKSNQIKILNEVPHAELAKIYPFIDLGVILYKDIDENFRYCAPNKLYEYWSYGVPVLAHQLEGLKSVFYHSLHGELINMDDLICFSNALERLGEKQHYDNRIKTMKLFEEKFHVDKFLVELSSSVQLLGK